MLVKALQLALEEDQEEREQNQNQNHRGTEHKQIESRKKLVPKSRRPVSKIEKQEHSKANENQSEEHPKHAKEQNETPNGSNVCDEVATNKATSGKDHNDEAHNDENMTQGDENQDQPISTPDKKSTTRPIFTTPFAVPAGNLQTLKLLWTAKTEMADIPGGILPEQKGT
ncbi:hypothetical protein CB0940_11986 [Cercospora beticola]|nr:hypothetical protein CB0940_11986 [Cercospora beticola]PIB03222.1 hypothetical protein CB0940_11986 [Cercospora beticola]